jgi:hypothetical protein
MPFAFLDIDNPVCAWAVYRGKFVLLPVNNSQFLSVWLTGLVRSEESKIFLREIELERVRASEFTDCVSRLRCIFCFETRELAEKALAWDQFGRTHFQSQFLTELSFEKSTIPLRRFDANWISHSDPSDIVEQEWMKHYWAGEAFSNAEPHWETLCAGTLIVLDRDIRERAYRILNEEFPESMMFLELARLAAAVGSDLGSISPLLLKNSDQFTLDYAMNFVDADNPEFFRKLEAHQGVGHQVNWQDIRPHFAQGSFGKLPNLKPYRAFWDIASPVGSAPL